MTLLFNEEFLVDLVINHTGGRSWDDHRNSVTRLDGRLAVVQTSAVHREIERLLSRLAGVR